MYQNVREYEAIVGSTGSDVRLNRIRWEIEQYKSRLLRDGAIAAARAHKREHPSTAVADQLISPPPAREVPQDNFHNADALAQDEAELAAEAALLEHHIPALRLPESSWRVLMSELERTRDAASRLQVIERWFDRAQCAYAMTEALVGHHVRAAEARAAAPPPRQSGPHSIAPWLRRS